MHLEFRQDEYEQKQMKHMDKEDERWEQIEKHMTAVKRAAWIGLGIFITLSAKDILSAMGLLSRLLG